MLAVSRVVVMVATLELWMAVLMVDSRASSTVVLKDYLTAVMLVLWMDSLKVVQMVAW